MELPETQAARAVERLAELGKRKRELMAELEGLDAPIRDAGMAAVELGVPVSRVIELAVISSRTYYREWAPDRRTTKRGGGSRSRRPRGSGA